MNVIVLRRKMNMNYSELLQLAKGWGNFVSDRINIGRLLYKRALLILICALEEIITCAGLYTYNLEIPVCLVCKNAFILR